MPPKHSDLESLVLSKCPKCQDLAIAMHVGIWGVSTGLTGDSTRFINALIFTIQMDRILLVLSARVPIGGRAVGEGVTVRRPKRLKASIARKSGIWQWTADLPPNQKHTDKSTQTHDHTKYVYIIFFFGHIYLYIHYIEDELICANTILYIYGQYTLKLHTTCYMI